MKLLQKWIHSYYPFAKKCNVCRVSDAWEKHKRVSIKDISQHFWRLILTDKSKMIWMIAIKNVQCTKVVRQWQTKSIKLIVCQTNMKFFCIKNLKPKVSNISAFINCLLLFSFKVHTCLLKWMMPQFVNNFFYFFTFYFIINKIDL